MSEEKVYLGVLWCKNTTYGLLYCCCVMSYCKPNFSSFLLFNELASGLYHKIQKGFNRHIHTFVLVWWGIELWCAKRQLPKVCENMTIASKHTVPKKNVCDTWHSHVSDTWPGTCIFIFWPQDGAVRNPTDFSFLNTESFSSKRWIYFARKEARDKFQLIFEKKWLQVLNLCDFLVVLFVELPLALAHAW